MRSILRCDNFKYSKNHLDFHPKEDETTDTSISQEQDSGVMINENIDRNKMTSSSMSSNMDKITRRSSRNF